MARQGPGGRAPGDDHAGPGPVHLLPHDRAIAHPEEAKEVVYHIALKGDDDPTSAFAQDARQKATPADNGAFDLHVRAVREPKPVETPDPPDEEYLKSSYFLDSAGDK